MMPPTMPTQTPLPLRLPRALAHLQARTLSMADADAALGLRRHILLAMPSHLRAIDPSVGCSAPVEQAWANTHLGPRAFTLGLWEEDTLVALACLLLADVNDPSDPGHLLGLPAHEWARTAHMAVCLAHEDYRGLRLQARLLNWRRDTALAAGRNLLLAMTACGNTYSRRNLLSAGLGLHWLGEWRPGSWWYGLAQDLGPQMAPLADQDHEWVALSDIARQQILLKEGFVGVAESSWSGTERRLEPRLQYVRRGANPLQPRWATAAPPVPTECLP